MPKNQQRIIAGFVLIDKHQTPDQTGNYAVVVTLLKTS